MTTDSSTTSAPSSAVAASPALDLEAIRRDFPVLYQEVNGNPLVYFDNGATSQKPRQVIDRISRYYEQDNSNVHRGLHELSNRSTEAFEAARERTARFLNAAQTEEIIFTRGTTESINLVAQTWGAAHIGQGDVILLTEAEHHSNIVPWQMLAERVGATVEYVPVTGELGEGYDVSVLEEKLASGRVKLLSFVHISNALGAVIDAAGWCAKARHHGATTLVDGAQSAGHMPVDVQAIGCDFFAFSSHKTCGPTGQGVLYGRRELLDAMPPWQGGGEMISTVDYDRSTWNQVPHKFEAGTPHIAGAIGLHAALDYLDGIGRDAIFRHDVELVEYAYEKLTADVPGIRILGPKPGPDEATGLPKRAGLVAFTLGAAHAHDIITLADARGIALRGGHHCTMPLHKKLGVPASARASFYLYNTTGEVDRLAASLARIAKMLG